MKVIWEKDLAIDSPVPWYFPLDTTNFSLNTFRLTAVGRFFTRSLVLLLKLILQHLFHFIYGKIHVVFIIKKNIDEQNRKKARINISSIFL